MTRKSKTLGLVLGAVLALSAVTASAASAGNHIFQSHVTPLILTGENTMGSNQIFGLTEKYDVSCSKVKVNGTETGTEREETTVHPVYNNEEATCSVPLLAGLTARVITAGCNFSLTGVTNEKSHASLHIECEGGKSIYIEPKLGCLAKIPEQTVSGVNYTNKEPSGTTSKTIKVSITADGLNWQVFGGNCDLLGLKDGQTGTKGWIFGDFTLKGYVDEESVEGAQTGIWTTES